MKRSLIAAGVSLALATPVFATNGMAPVGIGQSSKGIGGAGIAYPQDTLMGGINPAGMVHLGNRWDLGAEIFIPDRTATMDMYMPGAPGPMALEFDGNGSGFLESWFIIPEFGYNRMINDNLAVGISVFGNGGMNTTYRDGHPFTMCPPGTPPPPAGPSWCGDKVSIDLMQAFFVPTVSYKFHENWSVGVGLNLVAQKFKATGLNAFLDFSRPTYDAGGAASGVNKMTNNGGSMSYGASLRLGIQGELSDRVSVGATYQMKTKMSKFDEYAGLFSDQGQFDIPENYGIGVAFKATDKLDFAFDWQRVNYGKTNAIGNSPNQLFGAMVPPPAPEGTLMGDSNGPGFGWKNQTVYKLGAVYKYNDDLTLRAGYNYGKTPVVTGALPDLGMMLNSLAPGVVEKNYTLGFTYDLDEDSSITGSYIYTASKTQKGYWVDFNDPGPADQGMGASQPGTISMKQNAFGLSFNKRF